MTAEKFSWTNSVTALSTQWRVAKTLQKPALRAANRILQPTGCGIYGVDAPIWAMSPTRTNAGTACSALCAPARTLHTSLQKPRPRSSRKSMFGFCAAPFARPHGDNAARFYPGGCVGGAWGVLCRDRASDRVPKGRGVGGGRTKATVGRQPQCTRRAPSSNSRA